MRIAIVVWDLNIRGGTQRQALELALNLQDLGHTVDVYAYFYDKNECYIELCEKLNIYAVQVGASSSDQKPAPRVSIGKKVMSGYITPFFSIGEPMHRLQEKIDLNREKGEYDVINFHDNEVYKLSRIMKHANMVWMMNDVPRSGPIKSNHALAPVLNLLKRVMVYLLLKAETKNIHKIVVLDNRNHVLCKARYNMETTIVRSGIDLLMYEGMKIDKKYGVGVPVIFASSIFYPHRRFEDIVDAVEILKNGGVNVSVVINGRIGTQERYYLSIKNRIISKKLESSIKIINGLSEKELKEHYCAADFFIFPNHNQTWGLAVFEAMLAGCVCIVSKTSGASEVLSNDKNAILIDPLSPEEIAGNIMILLKNKERMKEISTSAVGFVRENLSWSNYAKQMLAVFSSL